MTIACSNVELLSDFKVRILDNIFSHLSVSGLTTDTSSPPSRLETRFYIQE